MSKLRIDLTVNAEQEIVGSLELPADGTFFMEAMLVAAGEFASQFGLTTQEVLADLYRYELFNQRKNNNEPRHGKNHHRPT